jgi:hypothetical protein
MSPTGGGSLYRVSHKFENDIATYITLNWLVIPKWATCMPNINSLDQLISE